MEINVETIKELIAALGRAGVDKLQLETPDFKLALEKNQPIVAAGSAVSAAAPAARPAEAPCAEEAQAPKGRVITSPIVGTFYSAAGPDKPPFAPVGKAVKKGDTLFIIESMKLMNEVASECDGTVAEVLVRDGTGVEYGQPILRIE